MSHERGILFKSVAAAFVASSTAKKSSLLAGGGAAELPAALLFGPLNLLAFALATVLGLSGAVFPIAGGALFSLFWGTLRSVVMATLGAVGAFWVAPSGASRVVQICRNQCDNDFSRRQEKNLFCQMNPGNGIETTWPGVTGLSALQGGERLPFFMALGFLPLLCFLPVLARRERFAPRRKPAYSLPLITHYLREPRRYGE